MHFLGRFCGKTYFFALFAYFAALELIKDLLIIDR